jgi:hypothetical protein
MSDDNKPSKWQQAIDGEWHGCPSLFEQDGTHVGTNKVSRASEFKDGRTTYWMDTRFDATGPLMDRFEIGSRMEFGVHPVGGATVLEFAGAADLVVAHVGAIVFEQ